MMSRVTVLVGVAAATIFLSASSDAGIVINEVAYYLDRTSDTGREWIELYNNGPEPGDLSGWDLYPGRSPHYLFPQGFVLAPGRFVLVHLRRDGVNTERDLYEGTAGINSNMPNTRGSVALFTSDSRDTIVDFMQYGAGGQTYEATAAAAGIWTRGYFVDTVACGWSLGLREDGADTNRPEDWRSFARPTPGYANVPPPFDVELAAVETEPHTIPSGQTFILKAQLSNAGLNPATGIILQVFHDEDRDSALSPDEHLWGTASAAVCSASLDLELRMPGLPEGQQQLAVLAGCSGDAYLSNSYRNLTISIGNPVAINEIMYAPPSGQAEWVEIFNRSERDIALAKWTIEDAAAQPRLLDTLGRALAPGQYALITSNPDQPPVACLRLKPLGTWPALNNDGDLIVLRDGRGAIVDQVHYYSHWGGGDGRSLERINPYLDPSQASSWGACVSDYKATPGAQNSIYAEAVAPASGATVEPNPFSPDGDGFQDHAVISLKTEWLRSVVNVKIFDRRGRLVAAPAVQREVGQKGSIVWDGKDHQGRRCPIGLYIVLVEAKEMDGSRSFRQKLTAAIAGRL